MKRLLFAIPMLLFLCYAPSMAQSASNQSVRVTVPFDFIVHDTTYPAGEYKILLNTGENSIRIGNADQWIAFSSVQSTGKGNLTGDTRLVFIRQDDKRYLHQVWLAGDLHGHDLLHKSMAQDLTE